MKRFLSTMLALLLLCSLLPAHAFASGLPETPAILNPAVTGGRYVGSSWQEDPACTSAVSANGNIAVSKTAAVGKTPGEFDLTLQVACKTEVVHSDTATVLVLDLSKSMELDNRLDQVKAVLTEAGGFLDSLRAVSGHCYVSVVTFQNYAEAVVTWADISDEATLQTVKDRILSLEARGATNMDAGLHCAYELLKSPAVDAVGSSVPEAYKNVILLSDGYPSRHNHKVQKVVDHNTVSYVLTTPYSWESNCGFYTDKKVEYLGMSETPDGALFTEETSWTPQPGELESGKVKTVYLRCKLYPWLDPGIIKPSSVVVPDDAADGQDKWIDNPTKDAISGGDGVSDLQQSLICYQCSVNGTVIRNTDLLRIKLGSQAIYNASIGYDVVTTAAGGAGTEPKTVSCYVIPNVQDSASGDGKKITKNEYLATMDGAEKLRAQLGAGHLYGVYFGENEKLGESYTETTADYLEHKIVSPGTADDRYFFTAKQKNELKDAFSNINLSISGLSGAGTFVTDPLSDSVSLVAGTLQTKGSKASEKSGVITWTLDPADATVSTEGSATTVYHYRMTYTVKLNQIDGQFHPANRPTILQNASSQKLIDFPVPGVRANLEQAGYVVRYFKDSLDTEPLGTKTENGVVGEKMVWTAGYLMPDQYMPGGVTFADGNADGVITGTPEKNVVNVLYVPDTIHYHTLSYTVQYYKDGVEVPEDAKTVSGTVAISQNTLPVNEKDLAPNGKYPGFTLERTEPDPLPPAAADGAVLKIYYVANTHEISYTVRYYKDGVEVPEDRLTYTETVPASLSTLAVHPVDTAEDRYSGYHFETTRPAVLPAEIADGGVIEVHYRKIPELPKPVPKPGSGSGSNPDFESGSEPDSKPDSKPVPPMLNTKDHFSYIIGCTDGLLRPTGAMVRAEAATIFFRLLTDEAREQYWCKINSYTDVPADLWCCNAISTLSNIGILNGTEDGSFRPNANITRAEFAKIAVTFFETRAEDYQGFFADVPDGAWYTKYVEAAASIGLVNGFVDGTFRPNAPISRAEACVIINRVIGRTPHPDRLLPAEQMITWPDNTPDLWCYADMQEATNSHDYTVEADKFETWTGKLPQRDWAKLEQAWSEAHSAQGGEVIRGE